MINNPDVSVISSWWTIDSISHKTDDLLEHFILWYSLNASGIVCITPGGRSPSDSNLATYLSIPRQDSRALTASIPGSRLTCKVMIMTMITKLITSPLVITIIVTSVTMLSDFVSFIGHRPAAWWPSLAIADLTIHMDHAARGQGVIQNHGAQPAESSVLSALPADGFFSMVVLMLRCWIMAVSCATQWYLSIVNHCGEVTVSVCITCGIWESVQVEGQQPIRCCGLSSSNTATKNTPLMISWILSSWC